MNRILPKILAVLTRHDRDIVVAGVDFQWSDNLWTPNIFRVYELIFGRRLDKNGGSIRAASKGWIDSEEGVFYQFGIAFEDNVALVEASIRQFFANFRLPKFKLVYFPVLTFQTPNGMTISRQMLIPYRFAIAIDNTGSVQDSAHPESFNFLFTGSNGLLTLTGVNTAAGEWPTNTTYNSVNMTQDTYNANSHINSGSNDTAFYSLRGPSTGTNAVGIAWTGSPIVYGITVASYTGVSQGAYDNSNAVDSGTGTTTSLVMNLPNVQAANCWAIGFLINDQAAPSYSVGAERVANPRSSADSQFDSAGTIGTGSQNITATISPAAHTYYTIFSIAPVAAAVTVSKSIISDLIIFN